MTIQTKLNNKGYIIPVSSLSDSEHKKLIQKTTIVPYKFDATAEELDKLKYNVYYYADKEKTEIVVPKFYGIYKYGQPKITEYDEYDEIDVEFTKELRPKQQKIAKLSIDHILNKHGGLLSLPCGAGKTVIALYIAAMLGYKTLIIVHLESLKDQWIERMMEFLDVKRERIGVIQGSVCDVEDKDFVVAMIQTISQKDYGDLFKTFGFVVYDEAHHMPAKGYSRGLIKTTTKYTLALSATPYRGDSTMRVLYWFTGPTIYKEEMKKNKYVVVKKFNYKCNDKKYVLRRRRFNGKFCPNTIKMLGEIIDIKARNTLLANIIKHLLVNYPERKILFLTSRCAHAEQFKEAFDEFIREFNLDVKSYLYIGPTKKNKRREAEQHGDIIFATYNMAQEGLDIKRMNTLIMATPKKDVVQTVGRIMRQLMSVNSVRPLIIDISDNLEGFTSWNNKRCDVYNKCEYEVNQHYVINTEFMTLNKFYDIDGLEDEDRPRHFEDYELNRIANDYNDKYIKYFNIIRKFSDTLQQLNAQIEKNRTGEIQYAELKTDDEIMKEYGIMYKDDDPIKYKVYEDFEAYKIDDIFNIPRVTQEDIEVVVSTSNDNIDDDGDDSYFGKQQKIEYKKQMKNYYKNKNGKKKKKKKKKNYFI